MKLESTGSRLERHPPTTIIVSLHCVGPPWDLGLPEKKRERGNVLSCVPPSPGEDNLVTGAWDEHVQSTGDPTDHTACLVCLVCQWTRHESCQGVPLIQCERGAVLFEYIIKIFEINNQGLTRSPQGQGIPFGYPYPNQQSLVITE